MRGVGAPFDLRPIVLHDLVLDLNGTLACDGILLLGIATRIDSPRDAVRIHLVSGDTFGTAAGAAAELGLPLTALAASDQATQELDIVRRLRASSVAVIGNGRNDALALAEAAVGLCVIGPEGAADVAVRAADVVVGSVEVALDLRIHPRRLVATVRR